jgi:prophage antirepressor-like protein
MNQQPILFSHPMFGSIRVIEVDGEVRFVGVDVARALDYAHPSKAVIDHCKGITKLGIPSAGGIQETNVITEGDVYRLIVKAADQSKNPDIRAKAERFERWVFDEILPSIRKTGRYEVPGQSEKTDAADALKVKRLEIMEMNAKTRQAKLLFDVTSRFKNRLSDKAIESMLAVGVKVLTGQELIPLPTTERLYTASDIAREAGVSANRVGRIANEYGLKSPEYGEYVLDKSPYCDKQVESFRYNERGRRAILELLKRELERV